MSRRRVFIFGLAASAAIFAGRASSGQQPRRTRPPRILLRAAAGGLQRAALGTYCWGTQCVDMGGALYPTCPLVVGELEPIVLDFAALGSLRRLAYTVWPYAEHIQPGSPHWSAKTGRPVVDEVLVFPVSPAPLPNDLLPGLYVIDVFAKARRGGDTYQGFKLRIESPYSAPTAAATPTATPVPEPICDDAEG